MGQNGLLSTYQQKMKDRIRQIMESQHMSQQVFADYIGLGAATLSSIFNGRTRPTLNVVEAIKKKLPDISIDWLMFGSGEMYQSAASSVASSVASSTDSSSPTFPHSDHHPGENLMLDFGPSSSPTPSVSSSASQNFNGVRNTRPEIVREEVKIIDKPQRKVIEIRVFYDDQTWDTFVPAKK